MSDTEARRPISAARLAANRANAKLSTGPKTPGGKARASLNGLTHGMRAEALILPGEDPQELQDRIDTWNADLDAATDAERYQVLNAVYASWRMDRCRDSEAAATTRRILEVTEAAEGQQAEELVRLITLFETDPREAVAKLRQTSGGCRWLIGQWNVLADHLVDFVAVMRTDRLRAIALMGKGRFDLFHDPAVGRWIGANIGAMCDKTKVKAEDLSEALSAFRPEAMSRDEFHNRLRVLVAALPEPARGYELAKQIVAEQIAELTERADLLAIREERDQSLRVREASIDTGPAGAFRLRYEMSHERALRNALRELRALQAARQKREAEEAPSEPTPEPDEAPSEANSEPTGAPSEPKVEAAPSEPKAASEEAPSEPNGAVEIEQAVVAEGDQAWAAAVVPALCT